jgi:hypothetical protein
MTWLFRRRFLVLLICLLLLFAGYPPLRGFRVGRLFYGALVSAVVLGAFQVVFTQRPFRVVALLLALPMLAGAWAGILIPDLPGGLLAVGFHTSAVLFLGLAVAVALRAIYEEKVVTSDSVYGALCGYFLVGLVFGHLYCLTEAAVPGSFRGGAELAAQVGDADERHFLLTYFSLATLTTVGYGDIVPVKDTARGLAVLEAIIGQFYVAVLIAELVGKRAAQRPTGP